MTTAYEQGTGPTGTESEGHRQNRVGTAGITKTRQKSSIEAQAVWGSVGGVGFRRGASWGTLDRLLEDRIRGGIDGIVFWSAETIQEPKTSRGIVWVSRGS